MIRFILSTFAFQTLVLAVEIHAESAVGVEASKVLIGQTLERERFGLRRGDVEMALTVWNPDRFVVYDAGGTADPRGWTVLHDDIGEYASALSADLQVHQYDIARSVDFSLVLEGRAFATTTDSGFVLSRQTGDSKPYKTSRLWFFAEIEEEWLATGVITTLGDSTSGSYKGPRLNPNSEITQVLLSEAAAWQEGSAGRVGDFLDKGYVGYDCYEKFAPASWLVVFANAEELGEWLTRRLSFTRYTIDRQVLHATVGQAV